jgi:hypothetical protein
VGKRVAAGQRRTGLQCLAQAATDDIKSKQTVTEFLVTINPNQVFLARDQAFLSIHAL